MSRSLLIAALCLTVLPLKADTPAPVVFWSKNIPDEQHIFVMYPTDQSSGYYREYEQHMRRRSDSLRATYPQSGLYRNTQPPRLLWSVDWYAHQVYIAEDAVHMVRMGPWASHYEQEALTFFAAGELLHSYRISELVKQPDSLPHSVSHFFWRAGDSLDNANRVFHVATLNGERYSFDITNGVILGSVEAFQWYYALVVAAILAGTMLAARRILPQRKQQSDTPRQSA